MISAEGRSCREGGTNKLTAVNYMILNSITVDHYDALVARGLVCEDDNVELIDGCVTKKKVQTPLRACTVQNVYDLLLSRLPKGWTTRSQLPIRLENSEPEPDIVIVRGRKKDYKLRHPVAEEIAVVIEVSDTTLQSDRKDKYRIYSEADLPEYWIVNLVDQVVEVYTKPGDGKYQQSKVYSVNQSITIRLKKSVIEVSVDELIT